jgi:hypothetical protein
MINSETITAEGRYYSSLIKKGSSSKTAVDYIRRLCVTVIIRLVYTAVLIVLLSLSGCNTTPNIRRGSLPTPTLGIPLLHPRPIFLEPDNLGSHSYTPNLFEKNGIVYTCDGGHIDISHVRANADDTRFLARKTYEALMKKKGGFSFNLAFEQSRHKIEFCYPQSWGNLSEKEREKTARELSWEIGAYITFNATLWHEIMSWFGVRFALIDPQFNSAFSWEDVYSNILGIKLAIKALKDPDDGYNEAMTKAIDRELKRLRVQPRKTAVKVTEKMRGKWFKGNRIPTMLRRNTDIGLDDGYISPVLTPGVCEDAEPKLLAAPRLDILSIQGFTMTYKIVPVYLEAGKVLRIIYPEGKGKLIEPIKHYPMIIDFINKEAVEKYNFDISTSPHQAATVEFHLYRDGSSLDLDGL